MNISQPSDPLEREADTVADHVVNNNPASSKKDSDKTSATPKIQRKAGTNNASVSIPASVSKTLNGPGQKLNEATRSKMESHLGADFGSVKIHTGASAAESSTDINAKAYTLGNDVVFNKDQYSPGTKEGDRLIAHELTHVVQQSGDIGRSILQRDELDAPVALDEEYEDDEDEGSETEEEEEEDEAEDGDTDVSDVVDYPELPDLPDDIEDDPVPMPTEPEADEMTMQKPIASSDNAEEMKGAKSRKIKSILVDQPTQQMTITFTSGSPKKHSISTGRGECGTKGDPCKSQNSHNCTPNGTFTIVSQGTKDTKNPKGDAMAWFVGLKVPGRKGIGIHNSQPVPGTPRSHGCVRTGNAAQDGGVAEMINKGVTYGKTKITIQGKAATKAYTCPKKKTGDKKKKKKKK